MPSAITDSNRILSGDAFAAAITSKPTYIYIGRETAWDDEAIPPAIAGSDQELMELMDGLLAVKKIEQSNIGSVIPRIDWESGVVYDAYDHRINVVSGRKALNQRYQFYVMTDEFNVYKCISNNNGAQSVFKPNSQQTTTFQTPDGYIWKYMYTVRAPDVFNFLTADWMPVYTLLTSDGSAQWNVQQTAINGGLSDIVLTSSGINYSAAIPPVVTIVGNGTGATASAIVNATTTQIERIVITDQGSGYTQATVVIDDSTGSGVGAAADVILSPVGGHGSDAKLELGGYHKMIKVSLIGEESGSFPITKYRQSGLVSKPKSTEVGALIYTNSVLGLAAGQTITGTTSSATGTIQLVEQDSKTLWIESVVGDFIQGESFTAAGVNGTIVTVENDTNILLIETVSDASAILPLSGKVLYISNRTAIQRVSDQTEEVRMVVTF